MLADEPTGNLDKKNTSSIIQLINNLITEHKISFVIATHNLTMVKKFDKDFKLTDGSLV